MGLMPSKDNSKNIPFPFPSFSLSFLFLTNIENNLIFDPELVSSVNFSRSSTDVLVNHYSESS